ncbi:MAG: RNA methyltransferase [Verrucomicrobiota bacterium]
MPEPTRELLDYLGDYVTEHKRSKMTRVLAERTRQISIALENVFQPHNASACLRTCDCLGIQDVHIVEGRNEYRPNDEVSLGSSKWLTLHRYYETLSCIESLRARGYTIVATTPHAEAHDLVSLPLERPLAIWFGTEEGGLTETALEAADLTLSLPMFGFTESYNISVTVAIVLARLTERLRSEGISWQLDSETQDEIRLEWYRKVVKRHDILEAAFWDEKSCRDDASEK